MNILLTGGTGFVGRALYPKLIEDRHKVNCVVRKSDAHLNDPGQIFETVFYIDGLNGKSDFKAALQGVDIVIHLAGRAHMPLRSESDMEKEFMDINFLGTKNLAEQAVNLGVKRFVFISTVGVNGKSVKGRLPYTEQDIERPYNSYTTSKLFAEHSLRKIEEDTGMEVVILRSPLVYGPGVKANFLKLLDLVNSGLPLPFDRIDNQRSFIGIDNFVDAVSECAIHPVAAGKTFLVSDGPPMSTTQLLEKIFKAFGKSSRLFYFSERILKNVLMLIRKKSVYDRLWGDLAVDSTLIRKSLGWCPPISFEMGIEKTVQWYLKEKDQAHDSSR
ncbi:MAG: NAD-dependent epimerase/dehydratase family protein [Desulfobacterales bacterium]|nr:NAD-dependent epimerase/dehydratase family protein [Desulfobacterales bacterium]